MSKNFMVLSLCCVFIILVGWISFKPALNNGFLNWDDQFYVTSNPLLQNPDSNSLRALGTKVVSLNFHPVTMVSLWINSRISGINSARPFILTNLFLHLCNSLLVFVLAYWISEKNLFVAIVTSMAFAIHPMHIESVVWVSERKDMLYAFFFLFSIISYWIYLESSSNWRAVISLVFFVLSCLSKAVAVSLVPCLFLIDYVRGRNLKSLRIYLEKIPFLLFSLLIGLIAIDVQGGGDFHGFLSVSAYDSAHNVSLGLGERISHAAFANRYYLSKFFVPIDHSAFHPYSMMLLTEPAINYLVSSLSLGLLILGLFKGWRQLVFGVGFYFCTILLVLQFIPVGSAIVAERYTYLPYIGLGYLFGKFNHYLFEHISKLLALILLLIVLIYGIQKTRSQSRVWADDISLFSQAHSLYPEDPFIRRTLASGYWAIGRLESAMHHILYAVNELGVVNSKSVELLANCHAELGDTIQALKSFDESVALDSNNISARYHRGIVLLGVDAKAALQDFDFCSASKDSYVVPLILGPRGRALGMLGRYDEAIRDLNKAVELYPNDISGYLDRAVTYEWNTMSEMAIIDYKHILTIDSTNIFAQDRLKKLLPLGK